MPVELAGECAADVAATRGQDGAVDASADDGAAPPAKRPRLSQHERRIEAHAKLGSAALAAAASPLFRVEREADGLTVSVPTCPGLLIMRRAALCSPAAAAAVWEQLRSVEAERLRWTALRDGGNPRSLRDTDKAYCCTGDSWMLRGGRYKQQLAERGRKANPLLDGALADVRDRVLTLVLALRAGRSCELLTEQLIRYLADDRWFAPHFDKDRPDASHVPVHPKQFDGPGDVLVTLCLGCDCTLIMVPRHVDVGRPSADCADADHTLAATSLSGATPRSFAVELRPGDVYMLADASRWEWKHGLSVSDSVDVERRAVVWRLIEDA